MPSGPLRARSIAAARGKWSFLYLDFRKGVHFIFLSQIMTACHAGSVFLPLPDGTVIQPYPKVILL